MTDAQLSRDNLIGFLDFAAQRGLLKKATAKARKIACQIILRILNETEASNLAQIDLEDVIQRHRNLAAGKISPITLKTYESRVQIAINDFIEYNKDPSSWKPSTKPRTRSVASPRTKTKATNTKVEFKRSQDEAFTPIQPSVHIDFQIHISPEAKPEQIDKIFASMREHLYPK